MALLRHATMTLAFLAGFYLAAMGVTYLVFPPDGAALGEHKSEETIFGADERVAIYDRGPIANDGRKVIFVGASDVQESFRPSETSAALGGMQVHNMAMGGMNMTTVDQVVDLILQATPPEGRKNLTIFLGIWYGLFTTDLQRFGENPNQISVEKGRYGLFRQTGDADQWSPVAGPRTMMVLEWLLRPVLLGTYVRSQYWDPFYYGNREKLMSMIGRGTPPVPNMMAPIADLDNHQLTDAQKRTLNARQNDKVGPVSVQTDEGYRHLLNVARKTSAAGVRVIVVDMPITSWHAAAMPQFSHYQQRKLPWIAALESLPEVRYVNVQGGIDDAEFSDFIHPRPRFTNNWALRAAEIIRVHGR